LGIIKAEAREGRSIEGVEHGASVSLILDESKPGEGPRLHRHPYDETWVVYEGNLTFQLGDIRHQVGPGDIVVAPPGTPHRSRTTDQVSPGWCASTPAQSSSLSGSK